jgi:hypothetical protein
LAFQGKGTASLARLWESADLGAWPGAFLGHSFQDDKARRFWRPGNEDLIPWGGPRVYIFYYGPAWNVAEPGSGFGSGQREFCNEHDACFILGGKMYEKYY